MTTGYTLTSLPNCSDNQDHFNPPGNLGGYNPGLSVGRWLGCHEKPGRFKFPPWGMDGGHDGSPNYVEILRNGKTVTTREIYGKPARVNLSKNDVVRLVTATGGGWGKPQERSKKAIEWDIRNGYITEAQANKFYR